MIQNVGHTSYRVYIRANQTDHPSSVFRGTKQLQRPSVIETNSTSSASFANFPYWCTVASPPREPLETSQEFQPIETRSTILFSSAEKTCFSAIPILSFQSSRFSSFCSLFSPLFRSLIDCRMNNGLVRRMGSSLLFLERSQRARSLQPRIRWKKSTYILRINIGTRGFFPRRNDTLSTLTTVGFLRRIPRGGWERATRPPRNATTNHIQEYTRPSARRRVRTVCVWCVTYLCVCVCVYSSQWENRTVCNSVARNVHGTEFFSRITVVVPDGGEYFFFARYGLSITARFERGGFQEASP